MKKLIIALLVCLPFSLWAQTPLTPEQQVEQAERQLEQAKAALEAAKKKAEEAKNDAKTKQRNKDKEQKTEVAPKWTQPITETKTDKKTAVKAKENTQNEAYICEGAVPIEGEEVVWRTTIGAPGRSADDIYNIVTNYLNNLIAEENQEKESKIALVNIDEHGIIATMKERLTLSKNGAFQNITKLNYVLECKCNKEAVMLTMHRITYNNTDNGKTTTYRAEELITDENALNSKRTRLMPITGKFRRATIDRKNEIFNGLITALKQ